jgi:hypothetical protein
MMAALFWLQRHQGSEAEEEMKKRYPLSNDGNQANAREG